MSLFIKPKSSNTSNEVLHKVRLVVESYKDSILPKYAKVNYTGLFESASSLHAQKLYETLQDFRFQVDVQKEVLAESFGEENHFKKVSQTSKMLQELCDLALEHKMIQEGLDIGGKFKDLYNFVERKLKGYSTGQVDRLIQKAAKMEGETDRKEIIEEINTAIRDAEAELAKLKQKETKVENSEINHKIEGVKYQIEVLHKLKAKVQSIDLLDKAMDKHQSKEDDSHHETNKDERVINIDESLHYDRLEKVDNLIEELQNMLYVRQLLENYIDHDDISIEKIDNKDLGWIDHAFRNVNHSLGSNYSLTQHRRDRDVEELAERFKTRLARVYNAIETETDKKEVMKTIDREIHNLNDPNYIELARRRAGSKFAWNQVKTGAALTAVGTGASLMICPPLTMLFLSAGIGATIGSGFGSKVGHDETYEKLYSSIKPERERRIKVCIDILKKFKQEVASKKVKKG